MKPYIAILANMKEELKFCRTCAKLNTDKCTFKAKPTDVICGDFEAKSGRASRAGRANRAKRRRKEKTFKLDLYAEVPETLKPCGFYEDTLTEAVWLPYRDEEDKVSLRPSVVIAKKGKEPHTIDFISGYHSVKGTFPSRELQSLMSAKGVQMLTSHMDIERQDVDKQIDEAVRRHLHIPDAERILVKRWIEGTFYYDIFDAYPIQNILGVSESGKSRLCLLNLALAYHAEGLIDPTEAGIFRSKEEDKVTLIADEMEYLNNPRLYATLKILINASYSKHSGYVTRYDEQEGKRVKRRFDLYSPMTISGIGGLSGVTLSRAFRIVMRRTNRDFPKANPNSYHHLRDMLYALRIRHCFQVRELYEKTDISKIVTARFEELFKPIFVMTEFFGTKEEHEILAQWCRDYQTNFRIEALNVAQEEMILSSLSKLSPFSETQEGWYALKDLADLVTAQFDLRTSSRRVSNVLYRLGLTGRKKVNGMTLVYAPPELQEESAKRIGLSFIATNATKSTSSTDAPKENWVDEAFKKKEKT